MLTLSPSTPPQRPVEYKAGAAQLPTALLQLATHTRCYLFRLSSYHGQLPTNLMELLRRPDVRKVGVGITGDRMKLERDFGIDFKGVVDLAELANIVLRSNQRWSLSGLTIHVLKQRLAKPGYGACPFGVCGWNSCYRLKSVAVGWLFHLLLGLKETLRANL
jgi:hypothetical protein